MIINDKAAVIKERHWDLTLFFGVLVRGFINIPYLSSINQRETAVLYRQAVVVAREGVSRTIASRCVLSSNELIINNFPLRTLRFKQTSYAA